MYFSFGHMSSCLLLGLQQKRLRTHTCSNIQRMDTGYCFSLLKKKTLIFSHFKGMLFGTDSVGRQVVAIQYLIAAAKPEQKVGV